MANLDYNIAEELYALVKKIYVCRRGVQRRCVSRSDERLIRCNLSQGGYC